MKKYTTTVCCEAFINIDIVTEAESQNAADELALEKACNGELDRQFESKFKLGDCDLEYNLYSED